MSSGTGHGPFKVKGKADDFPRGDGDDAAVEVFGEESLSIWKRAHGLAGRSFVTGFGADKANGTFRLRFAA